MNEDGGGTRTNNDVYFCHICIDKVLFFCEKVNNCQLRNLVTAAHSRFALGLLFVIEVRCCRLIIQP